MDIIALVYVSMSEIVKVKPEITYDWIEQNPEGLREILWDIGMDTKNYPFETQPDIQHRNRFNEVVQCHRFVGNERLDKQWLISGYASIAAKDKAKRSKLLVDMYRLKGEAE